MKETAQGEAPRFLLFSTILLVWTD